MGRNVVTVHLWRPDAEALYEKLGEERLGVDPARDRLWAHLGEALGAADGRTSMRARILAVEENVVRIGGVIGVRAW